MVALKDVFYACSKNEGFWNGSEGPVCGTKRTYATAADASAEICFPLRQQLQGGTADFPEPVIQPRRFWQLLTIFAVL
ncbi:MAG: hypothetical protein ACI8Q6_003483, partial [Granulosicoccus sp.]